MSQEDGKHIPRRARGTMAAQSLVCAPGCAGGCSAAPALSSRSCREGCPSRGDKRFQSGWPLRTVCGDHHRPAALPGQAEAQFQAATTRHGVLHASLSPASPLAAAAAEASERLESKVFTAAVFFLCHMNRVVVVTFFCATLRR